MGSVAMAGMAVATMATIVTSMGVAKKKGACVYPTRFLT